jgi:hypothetical protein
LFVNNFLSLVTVPSALCASAITPFPHYLAAGFGFSSGVNRACTDGWPGSVMETTTFMSGTG